MTDNKESIESQEYSITFNFEFLDDLYSVLQWSEKGSSDSGSSSGKMLVFIKFPFSTNILKHLYMKPEQYMHNNSI